MTSQVEQKRHLRVNAMLIVALLWGMIPLLGAIPFVAIASYLTPFTETPQTIRKFQYPYSSTRL
ncbi:MAG: hypothetical protein F6K28_14790 [Microcoleus sp. SIO2G3]|nr:hypothetical protein [Microcoleus sp. SIO2G3]